MGKVISLSSLSSRADGGTWYRCLRSVLQSYALACSRSCSIANFRMLCIPTTTSPLHPHSPSYHGVRARSLPMQERPPCLLNIVLALDLILRGEVILAMLAQPGGHLAEFFADAVDGLRVHVGLRDEFGHRYYIISTACKLDTSFV